MAEETVQTYRVRFKFDESVKKLQGMQQTMQKFNKQQESTLRRQIKLQSELNRLQLTGGISKSAGTASTTTSRKTPASNINTNVNESLKTTAELERVERQRLASLEKAKNQIKASSFWQKKEAGEAHDAARAAIREHMAKANTASELRMMVAMEKESLRLTDRKTKEFKRQSFLMNKMTSSSKQFAGNLIGAFALASGGRAVVQAGQDFESVRNTMLSVSESSKAAGDNFEFVRGEAHRLGISLVEGGRGFAKMVAARGDMSMDDTKESFKAVAEQATLMGLSTAESSRAINALMQMMSKGVVTSEELKLQMGEVLPSAISTMAKAAKDAGISVSGLPEEMYKLQDQGKLISSKVLPFFAKRMREAAAANGGLEKALKSNATRMKQLGVAFQDASDQVFRAGLGEGLSALFASITKLINDNIGLWKALGATVGAAFHIFAAVIKSISFVISGLSDALNVVVDIFGEFTAILTLPVFAAFYLSIRSITVALISGSTAGKGFALAMDGIRAAATRLMATLWPLLAVLAALKAAQGIIAAVNMHQQAAALKGPKTDIFGNVVGGSSGSGKIQVHVNSYLDGEKVAQSVAKSSTMKNGIDERISNAM